MSTDYMEIYPGEDEQTEPVREPVASAPSPLLSASLPAPELRPLPPVAVQEPPKPAVRVDKTPLEEIELLDVSKAARLCGLKREYVSAAMDRYKATRGRMGLAYVVIPGSSRRRVRRASLRRYFEELERRTIYS